MNTNKLIYGNVDVKSLKLYSGDTREEGGVIRYTSTTGKYEGYNGIDSKWDLFGGDGEISTITGATNGLSVVDDDIVLGGNLTGNTNINLSGKTLNFLLDEEGFFSKFYEYNDVHVIELQLDNKILVGGYIVSYSGVSVNGIIRLNSDSTIDQDFLTNMGSGFNGAADSIQIQSDGKILVGGNFSSYSGITANYFIRLNSDGTIDQDFLDNMGSGFDYVVNSIQIQLDDKILIGGEFTSYSGVTATGFIRLNSDGTIDQDFLTNMGDGFGNYILSIKLQLDGKILVGGNFTTYSGVTANRLIRLNSDGTIDQDFLDNMGSGFNDVVNSIQLQSDDKILVGGVYTSYSGVSANSFIRLNSDGTIDHDFLINMGDGFYYSYTVSSIYTIQLQLDSKILIGGQFTSYSGVTVNYLIRLNSDGTIDQDFLTNMGDGFDYTVYSIKIQSDNKILVVGTFEKYDNITNYYLIRLNSDGTIDNTPINNEMIFDGKSIKYGSDNNIIYNDNTLVHKEYVDGIRGSYILKDFYIDITAIDVLETDLYSYTILPNLLANNGDKIIATYSLISNSADGYIKGYFAGNLLMSNQVVNTWGSTHINFKIEIIRTSSTSFRYTASWNCLDGSSVVHLANTINDYSSEDWTIDNILKITGTASAGSITAKMGFIEYISAK
jgi:uncharacterized delta-60 repeat protein